MLVDFLLQCIVGHLRGPTDPRQAFCSISSYSAGYRRRVGLQFCRPPKVMRCLMHPYYAILLPSPLLIAARGATPSSLRHWVSRNSYCDALCKLNAQCWSGQEHRTHPVLSSASTRRSATHKSQFTRMINASFQLTPG